ncbi:MAG: hypothetical protein ACOY42_12860 [Pseudomonadota bacterium]|jgi:hypothetical protein
MVPDLAAHPPQHVLEPALGGVEGIAQGDVEILVGVVCGGV